MYSEGKVWEKAVKSWLWSLLLLSNLALPCYAQWSRTLDVTMQQGQPYVPLVTMARSLGLAYQISPELTSLQFKYADREVSVGNAAIMLVSNQFIPLSTKPYWQGQELWVPLDAVQKIFSARINWHVRAQEVVFTVD